VSSSDSHSSTGFGTGTFVRVQGADHPVLALHVVRGGQYMAERGRRTTHFAVPSVTA